VRIYGIGNYAQKWATKMQSTLNYELPVPADLTIQNETFQKKEVSKVLPFIEKQKVS
jgi:hypothetical protein